MQLTYIMVGHSHQRNVWSEDKQNYCIKGVFENAQDRPPRGVCGGGGGLRQSNRPKALPNIIPRGSAQQVFFFWLLHPQDKHYLQPPPPRTSFFHSHPHPHPHPTPSPPSGQGHFYVEVSFAQEKETDDIKQRVVSKCGTIIFIVGDDVNNWGRCPCVCIDFIAT